jgi:hypothetical protein
MLNEHETLKQDGRLGYIEFLNKVGERLVDRAKEREVRDLFRLGNVWRLNSAEASITQDGSSGDMLLTIRCGPNAARSSQHKVSSVDSTADAIIDRLEFLRRTAGNDH